MAEVATAPAPAVVNEVLALLADNTMTVKELQKKVKAPLAIAKAWAAGEVEFGRRTHVHNGPIGKPDKTTIIVEQGWAWSGAKAPGMKGFRDLVAEDDKLPKAKDYKEYPAPPENADELKEDANAPSPLVTITEAQAHALIGLHVRLTDKGLSALQA